MSLLLENSSVVEGRSVPDIEAKQEEHAGQSTREEIRITHSDLNPQTHGIENKETLHCIFEFSQLPEVFRMIRVSKGFRQVGTSDSLWEIIRKDLEGFIPRDYPIRPSFLENIEKSHCSYFSVIRNRLREGYEIREKLLLDRFDFDIDRIGKTEFNNPTLLQNSLLVLLLSSFVWSCPCFSFFGLILEGILGTAIFKHKFKQSKEEELHYLYLSPLLDTIIAAICSCCGFQIIYGCIASIFTCCYCCCCCFTCILPLQCLCSINGGFMFSVYHSFCYAAKILLAASPDDNNVILRTLITSVAIWCLLITFLPASFIGLLVFLVVMEVCLNDGTSGDMLDFTEDDEDDDEFRIFERRV